MITKILTILFIIVIDQISKFWALTHLKGQEALTLIPNVLELHYTENTGIAFSMMNDRPEVLVVLNSLIIIVLIVWSIKNSSPGLLYIIAGGIGNLLDRFIYGHVIDFINPLFVNFAVFNLADVALNVGVILLIWSSLVGSKGKTCFEIAQNKACESRATGVD